METTIIQPHKSSLGVDANIASLIIYIVMAAASWIPILGYLSWALPLVFFFLEKESKFVKFNAVQALIIGVVRVAIAILFKILVWIATPKDLYAVIVEEYLRTSLRAWVVLGAIATIVGLAITALIVYLMIMAYGYKQIKLPAIGPIAEKVSEKLDSINTSKPDDSNPENKTDSDDQNTV